jgi:hypothetical protein
MKKLWPPLFKTNSRHFLNFFFAFESFEVLEQMSFFLLVKKFVFFPYGYYLIDSLQLNSPELQICRYQILRHHYRIQLEHVRTYKKEIKSRFFRGVIDSRSWWLYISSLLSLEKTYLSLYLPSTLYKINVCQNEQDKILKYQYLIKHEELKQPLIYRWFMNESLKILNGQSEAVNRRTDNTTAKKRSKRQTMVDRTLFKTPE